MFRFAVDGRGNVKSMGFRPTQWSSPKQFNDPLSKTKTNKQPIVKSKAMARIWPLTNKKQGKVRKAVRIGVGSLKFTHTHTASQRERERENIERVMSYSFQLKSIHIDVGNGPLFVAVFFRGSSIPSERADAEVRKEKKNKTKKGYSLRD